MMNAYVFGYPTACNYCGDIPIKLQSRLIGLRVAPHRKNGKGPKVMLIGQDPTVAQKPDRVKEVLMLDEPNGQLSRWLKGIFGIHNFQSVTLYATNVVKCTFSSPPSRMLGGGLRFLKPYFQHCQQYLPREVLKFRPDCVITLGEPAHAMFASLLDNSNEIAPKMKNAFKGALVRASLRGFEFDYSPCLHIQTYRVAEKYGARVESFKQSLLDYLSSRSKSE